MSVGDDDEGDEVLKTNLLNLDAFTGRPLPGDDLLTAIPLAGVVLVVGERVTHLRRRVGRFVQRSFTDRLTGLFNYDFLQAKSTLNFCELAFALCLTWC